MQTFSSSRGTCPLPTERQCGYIYCSDVELYDTPGGYFTSSNYNRWTRDLCEAGSKCDDGDGTFSGSCGDRKPYCGNNADARIGCTGMCGNGCYSCWMGVCGDCCNWKGCWEHDHLAEYNLLGQATTLIEHQDDNWCENGHTSGTSRWCQYQNDGVCDEAEGTDRCYDGFDGVDCMCDSGEYMTTGGVCTACPAGRYRQSYDPVAFPTSREHSCISCPSGRTSAAGSVTSNDCYISPPPPSPGTTSGSSRDAVPASWIQVLDRYCGDSGDIASYNTAAEAQSACDSDASCLYISDGSCDNEGVWETCSDDGQSSSAGSCMYQHPAASSSPSPSPTCDSYTYNPPSTFTDGSGSSDYVESDCQWKLRCGSGEVVRLSFSNFHTESGYDYVTLYEGDDASGRQDVTTRTEIASFHGNDIPLTTTSTGRTMLVQFDADEIFHQSGWSASWSCESSTPLTCGQAQYLSGGSCASCQAGRYQSSSSHTESTCSVCSAGHFTASSSSDSDGSGVSTGASHCNNCPAGKYNGQGDSSCSTCSAGHFTASSSSDNDGSGVSTGASHCNNCPAGKYNGQGDSSCSTCSGGDVTASTCS